VNKKSVLKEEIQERIENAVLRIFSKSDFHKATMRQVAKEAKVSFETIYKNYGSKENMLFSFMRQWLEKSFSESDIQGIAHSRERIRKFSWVEWKYYVENPEIGVILFMTVPLKTWMEDETFKNEKIAKTFVKLIKEGQATGYINPSIPPSIIVDFWVGMMTRSYAMWASNKKIKSLLDEFDVRFAIFWNGIANKNRLIEIMPERGMVSQTGKRKIKQK
jgi:AcrR family transcriptional regulator